MVTANTYHSTLAKGQMVSQSVKKGVTIDVEDELKLVYSLGKIDVSSFIGKTKLDVLSWQTDFNSKGANITVVYTPVAGGTAGNITTQDVVSDYVSLNATITVTV